MVLDQSQGGEDLLFRSAIESCLESEVGEIRGVRPGGEFTGRIAEEGQCIEIFLRV
jgi:hypothetical protein